MSVHVLQERAVHIGGALEVLQKCWMLWHSSHVFPVLFLREAHDVEDPIQLVVVIRVAGFDVLLSAMKDWFTGQELSENTTNSPDIDRLCVVTRPQEELWCSVPESYYHRIEVCQRLQRRIEEPCKTHVCNLHSPSF